MAVLPDRRADTEVAQLRRSFMHAHTPPALRQGCGQGEAAEPGAGYFSVSAARHVRCSWSRDVEIETDLGRNVDS
jgi:hypothetical protein